MEGGSGPPAPGSSVLLPCPQQTPAAQGDLSVSPLSYLGLRDSLSILTHGPVTHGSVHTSDWGL